MTIVLQVVWFVAGLAIIVLAACLIPMAILAWRRIDGLARAGEEIKGNLDLLLKDTRELVQNVNILSKRAQRQMDDVDQVMHTVQSWTARADRLIDGVGLVIEPPVFSLVAISNLVRSGAGAFIQSLFHAKRSKNSETIQPDNEESEHV